MIKNHKRDFQKFVSIELNSSQKKAVSPKNGSFLVIAGAGSGKTRVITARITNLILEHEVEPSEIIALTFTNKAAQEMQERINNFLPDLQTKPIIATFHSYCLRILKMNRHLLNSETFSIIDSQDQTKLIQKLLKEQGIQALFKPKQLAGLFSSFKMANVLKLNSDLPLPMHHMQQFMELYNNYEQEKRASNYFDFDDLLYKTFDLFNKNEAFQLHHLRKYRHILIDEYQDTNLIQHELFKRMTLLDNKISVDSICAVGDEDQSIYSWRGAQVSNILDFDKEFNGTKLIKLEQNYRSSQQILDIANKVIKNNHKRNHKKLWSDLKKNQIPLQLECLSDLQESYTIANSIKNLAETDKLSSIAILYRTHYQSRVIEEALIKESIPYKMIGGIQFYERKEIKDLIAYLRLIVNKFDKISLFRVLNCPLRGLGKKAEESFLELWERNPLSTFLEISQMMISEKKIAPKQQEAMKKFIILFEGLNEETDPAIALEKIIQISNYKNYIEEGFEKAEAKVKKDNVAEFIRAAEYSKQTQTATVAKFLEDIALMQEHMLKESEKQDSVFMMTLHSAKGLEFETVFLSGVENGILPSNQSIENGNIEEERRLFYVGITRAKKKLIISHAKYRNTFGQMTTQEESRFLEEIPENLLHKEKAKHWSKPEFTNFFKKWLTGTVVASVKSIFKNFPMPEHIKKAAIEAPKKKIISTFKRLQTVKHSKFGVGITQLVEKKGEKTFITVHFRNHGKKKIESSFLTVL